MPVLTERAPAKINLTLRVQGRRPDNFHELQSLVAFAGDAADSVALDTSLPEATVVTGPFGETIAGKNLLDLTLAKVAEAAPQLRLGQVTLEKNLPVAAGIGGGSADAAALLRMIRRANPDNSADVDWMGIAARLGADVPVCLLSRSAWMTGIGERITPLDGLPTLEAVLVNPLQPMPADKTARVFRTLAAPHLDANYRPPSPPDVSRPEALLDFMRAAGNDLSAPAQAVAPVIGELLRAIGETPGCRYAAVSGGGPTCFGIFDDARLAAQALAAAHPGWWVCRTALGDPLRAD